MKLTLKIIIVGFLSGLAGAYLMLRVSQKENPSEAAFTYSSDPDIQLAHSATSDNTPPPVDDGDSFSVAAARATPSVVFIKSISPGASYSYLEYLFGGTSQTQVSSGSGVIFTTDGYVVTNNHVVRGAEKIEIIHDKKVYDAELIGTDPSTDLAVLKIDETNLPAIPLGSSANVRVGEWVLAIGNPYSLSSTVTAGIVSAKGRRIGILEDKFPIESFIQTDAAINPGNSGGALVNKDGELIGINSAILSRTGSYTGYAFAVPSDIVKKVVKDLVTYGVIQKALVGGGVVDFNYETANKYNLGKINKFNGVFLELVDEDGPAEKAGLKKGDIITAVNGQAVNSQSEFEEILSYHYPGDKIKVDYRRGDESKSAEITLVNRNGETIVYKRNIVVSTDLGVSMESLDDGVKIFKIKRNGFFDQLGLPEDYTITSLNRVRTKDPKDVTDFFEKYKGRVVVYGSLPSGAERNYSFYLR